MGKIPWTDSGYGSAVTLGSVSEPIGVQLDAQGNLYIAEDGGTGVVEVPRAGSGYGSPVTLLTNNETNAVALDASGNLYFAYSTASGVNLAYKLDLADGPSHTFPTITAVGATDTTDGPLTVTVTNDGTAQLTFSASPVYPASFPANSGDANLCSESTSLAAGDSCDLSLQFQPSAAGVNQGSIPLADNAVNSNQALVLSGTGQMSVAEGSSQSAGPAVVSISTAGTLASIEVLTEGVQNLDFTNAGTGTCTVGNAYTASQSCTVTLSFSPTHPGLRRGAVLLLDAGGNVLGTTYVSDVGVGPQIAFGSGTQSTISLPGMGNVQDMAVDGNGNLFVLDISNGNVAEVPWNGSTYGTPVTVISTGTESGAIALDAAGNLYLADNVTPQIWKYPRTSSSFGTRVGLLPSNFGNPTGLLVDGFGNIYFSLDSYTSPIYEIAWTGSGYAAPVAAINTAEYGAAYSIAMDANRNFFFTDQQDGAVFEVPWTSSGYGTPVSIGGEWSDPGEIQVDAADNLYVANAHEYEAPGGLIKVPWTGSGYGGPILLTNSDISAVALDAGGNAYINNGTLGILKLDFADAPTRSFADTAIGHDTDPAQTVTITNQGNAALTFSADPSYPSDFPVNAEDGNLCEAANPVAQNGSCDISVNFAPAALGSLQEQITFADNTASGTHAIPVTGTSLDAVTQLVLSSVPANLPAGGNAGTLTVSEEDPFGTVQATAADTITLTVTGPNSYSATYTATAASGVATFNLAGDALSAAGTYSYAASLSGASGSSATETVVPLSLAFSASQNVNSTSDAVSTTVYISTAGTLNSIQVLTQGTPNLDFAVSPAGSCATGTAYAVGQSCTVNVTFTPQAVGQRTGAVVLRDAGGNLLGLEYLSGLGTAPQAAMIPGAQSAVSGTTGAAGGVAVDAAHNLYFTATSGTAVKLPWSGSAWGSPVTLNSGLTNPQGIAVDGAGNVYIAAGEVIEVPWTGSAYGTPVTVGSGISGASAIAVDAGGNIYINQSSGAVELPWTGSGYGAPITVLSAPSVQIGALALDASGNLYVAESALGQVVEVPWSGTSWGSPVTVASGLSSPQGLTFDGSSLCVVEGGSGTMILLPWTGSSYGAAITVATSLTSATGVAVDGSGNSYVVAAGGVVEIDLADGGSLTFPATPIGTTNTASPQTATLINVSSQPLAFSVGAYSAAFPQNASGTNLCLASGFLVQGTSCNLSMNFAPAAIGPNAGTLTVTDNTLNTANSTQNIALNGTGLDIVTQLAMSTVPPSLFTGGNAGTITVSENDSSGVLVSTATDTITLLVTGPSGYSQTYTVAASGGVATFDLSGDALSTPGTYTYAASLTGVAGAGGTETVFPIDVNLSSGQNLGSASSAQAIPVSVATAGTLNSIQVLTEGIANGDFTAASGGTCASGTAYTVGQSCTVNVQFNPQYAGLRTGAVVLTDSTGNILGTVYLSGTGLGPQLAYPPGVQSSVPGTTAYAVAVDGAGNLYYATGGSPGQAIKVPWTGTSWGTPVTLLSGLNYPYSIAVDGAGNVYIGELLNGDVLKVTWNGTSYSSTPVTVATGVSPDDLAVDRNGNVYIASGSTVVEVPWTGNSYSSPVTVTSSAGGGVAVDAAGNVYTGKNPATFDTPEGTVIELPWTGSGWGAAETLASGFYYPTGVALDSTGSVYVADSSGETLTKIPWTGSGFGTPVTLASGLPQPQDVALDAAGNVYIASYAGGEALKLDLGDAPSPTFPTATVAGTLDTADSSQTISLLNIGNEPLTFSADPSYPASFPVNTGDANLCSSATPISVQNSCDVSVVFQPAVPGPIAQSVTLTDNAIGGSQSLTFNGTGVGGVSQLAISGVPAQLPVGGNAGTVTVSEEDSYGTVVSGAGDTITLTVTGPNSYSQTYTSTASAGVATFDLTGAPLTAAGTYTYTASLSGVTSGTATETVFIVAVGFSATTNVTSSSMQSVPVYITAAGTANAIQVLTQGAPNLDFTDAGGDSCATGTAYAAGQTCMVNVTFTPQRAGVRGGAVVLMDASGNVLGETYLSAVGVAPQIGFLGAAPATLTLSGLGNPADVAMDGSGNLYVIDSTLNEVLEFPGSGTTYSGPVVIASGFSSPLGIAVDGAGDVYVADSGNSQIVKVPRTGMGTTGYGTPAAVLTGLNAPAGVAVDGAGNLYVADTNDGQILQLPWSGTGYGAAIAVASGLSNPWGVAVDANGDVFFSDTLNGGRVAEVPWTGGSYGASTDLYTGSSPNGLAVDDSGNLYITQSATSTVIELPWNGSSYGSAITTTASGSGVEGIAVDASGNLLLAETSLGAIARVDVADAPTLNFPTATTQFSTDTTDGPQTTAVINNGNAPLPLFSGINPGYPSQFPKNTADTNLCASGGSVAEGTTCDLSANFAPTATGAVSGQIILIDNTLNVTNKVQYINLNGTGLPAVTGIAITSPPQAVAGTPFTITAVAQQSGGGTNGDFNGTAAVTTTDSHASLPATVTFSSGGASFSATLTTAGNQTITLNDAAVGGANGTSSAIQVTAAAPSSIAVSAGTPQSAYLSAPFATPLTVLVTDSYGNIVANADVTFTAPASGASATLSAPQCFTGSNGICQVTATANATVGSYTVTATINGTSDTVSFSLTNNPPPNLVVTTSADDAGTAANCTVQASTTTGTDRNCSLRDALLKSAALGQANIYFGSSEFGPGSGIAVSSPLSIPSGTAIVGPTTGSGPTLTSLVTVTVNGSGFADVTVNSGVTGASISNMTITQGSNSGPGGCLVNAGGLTLTNVALPNCFGNANGAVIENTGSLTLANSNISSYTYSQGNGGCIDNSGTLQVFNTTIANCSANGNGGAINNSNFAILENSSLYGNGGQSGGGIENSGTLVLVNTTLYENSAGSGGGVDNTGTFAAANVTFSGNWAASGGAGISNSGGLQVQNTILAGDQGPECLATAGSCPTNGAGGNVIGVSNPGLLPLANYGGNQLTLMPLPGSAAICAGSSALVPIGVTADERGLPLNASCVDAGAVQTNYVQVNTLADTQNSDTSSCTDGGTCSLRDAVLQSAANPDIGFAPALFRSGSPAVPTPATLTLSSPLNLTQTTMNLAGPGANLLTISGGGTTQLFTVSAQNANISAMTLASGKAANGGAILHATGQLNINNVKFSGNQATQNGGAIDDKSSSTLTIANSTLTNNTAGGSGGGLAVQATSLNLLDSTLTGNSAASGGGLSTTGNGFILVSSSTITGNSAPANGSGWYLNATGSYVMVNSILAGNTGSSDCVSSGSATCPVNGDANGDSGDVTSASGLGLSPLVNAVSNTAVPVMIPLPGSAAICAGTTFTLGANNLFLLTDARGVTFGAGGYCASGSIDAGAVQTDYAMSFKAQPSNVVQNSTMSPAPAVTLDENGAPFTVSPVTIPLTLTSSPSGATLTGGSVATSAGVATYSGLTINAAGTGDTLTATLVLNPAITPTAPAITATSGTFNVASEPPFGEMTAPADAVTGSKTVTQGDSVLVTGWAADVHDGAPVHQVSILIDGTAVGNATLGIARPGIATEYGSAYLNSGWTYMYSGSLAAGTHTMTAVLYDSLGLSTQLPTHTFTVSSASAPPYGALTQAVDAITKTTPVGQTDGLLVTGWAADLVQGAPVSQVTVFIDGTSVGNATLSVAGPSGEPANSGWTFTDSTLTTGTHTVSVVAYDSGGRSATLGSRTITVQANAPPFGMMTAPADAVTSSTTVTQGDGVLVTGWAADVHDGAPVHQVSILIDGTAVGNATLGIARPGIATEYGSAYLNSGWTYTYSGSLAAGTHTMTVVLYDSLGLSTQLPTHTFTVSSASAPPYGALTQAVDAITKTTPVGQTDGLLVTGWAADLVQGAPVSQVKVFIDGTSVGNATLSVAGPSGEPANSGWTFTDATPTTGTHTVSVVAYDSGGRSATLGSRTITVQANAPPFGVMTSPEDAVTGSTTVTQGDHVLVTGWAADVHDGAPITRVSISIDGTAVGNATLGIARPGIAADYGSAYLHSGWTYTYSGSLAAGTHTMTAVLYDSLGLSTQLPTKTFTVTP